MILFEDIVIHWPQWRFAFEMRRLSGLGCKLVNQLSNVSLVFICRMFGLPTYNPPTQPFQKAASSLRKTFTKRIPHYRRKRRLTLINTWLPPTISQERSQWRIHWHQLLKTKQTEWQLWTIRDKRPLLQIIRHFADENTDWLWTIRDCRLVSGI